MALNSPPSSEEQNLRLYKWKEKSESSVAVNGTETEFTFEAISSVTIQNMTKLHTTNPTADYYIEDATKGKYTYYKYASSAWSQTTGSLSAFDCRVYFRKNGVDTPVDGSLVTVTSGSTHITVTFTNAPTTAIADKVLLSYTYVDVTNPDPTMFNATEYNPKYAGRDYTVIQCFEGKIFKRRAPLDLTEVSFKVLKMDNSLAATMMGERTVSTIGTNKVRNVSGGNYVYPRVLVIKAEDPDDSTKTLMCIYRNIGTTSVDFSSSVDAEMEENITIKCEPEHTIELEITTA